MKTRVFITVLCCLLFSGCGKNEDQEAAQRAYEAEAARNRAIWDANPGGEMAAMECGQLADASAKYQAQYSRDEVYRTCMQNKGFGHLVK